MNDSYPMARSRLVRLSRFAAFATCVLMGAKAQSLQSGVSVGRNQDGRLEIFTILNGSVWHNWQLGYDGLWSGWVSLGAPVYGLCNQIPECDIGVGLNSDGRMQIFVKTSQYNRIYTAVQAHPGDVTWYGWGNLDGPDYCCADSAPAVGQNADGRLELFVNGENDVWHKWQYLPGSGWLGWENLGDGRNNSVPTVGVNSDGRLQVFAVSLGSAVHSAYQLCPGCGWSSFYSLGSWVNSVPAVGQNYDGRMEIFALDGNHNIIHNWQVDPSGDWSGWFSLGDGRANGRPTVARNLDGRLEVFVISNGSAILHNTQLCAGCDWSGFTYVSGGWLNSWPGVGQNSDGRLEVFAYGADNIVYNNWQVAPGGDYSGWSSLGRPQ